MMMRSLGTTWSITPSPPYIDVYDAIISEGATEILED